MIIINNFDNEIPKYRKKKESSTSKSKTKSTHRHEYIDYLLIEKGKPYKAICCEICGKIGDVKLFESEPCENIGWRMLTSAEIFEKYNGLEQIEVDDIFQKFITIKKGGDIET